MKIIVLILTCLASTPQEACTRETALDVREVTASPGECGMAGLATAAADPRGGDGLRLKIVCGRPVREERASNGGS
ncbi:hypothetical protein [Methylocella silvestris]|uniref:Ribosomal protein S27 n=1 Tax=Methylocella silvestris TaxID=199596 RepID=A0A2J7TFI5_METSI|nr:hypothetical protein [Methylocella silvestris]PNG25519.1 hypothetical protein CR492_13470 [Methylocella silvestris]